ncbi:hypothetical protein GCM10028797_25780 [Dyella agri]
MKVTSYPVLIALAAIISMPCLADVDGCTKMTKVASDAALPTIKQAFAKSGRFPLDRVEISRGRDCDDSIYFVFEAKPAYRNVGSHWFVSKDKKTVRFTFRMASDGSA